MSSSVAVDRDLQAPGQRSANFKFAFPAPYTPLRLGQIAPAAPPKRTPKIRLNLPKETVVVLAADGRLRSTRSHFARTPIPPRLVPPQAPVPPPDVITTEIYPPDSLRVEIPNSIDVFLPGQSAWDAVKKKFIEEKEKLDVEESTGSSTLHVHAPHAPIVTISSPVDSALLFFKLNKLQQTQNSLAPDASRSPDARSDLGLPNDQSLAPPTIPARAESPPDFIRGFGLDAPDEAEEEPAVTDVHEAEPMLVEVSHIADSGADDTSDMELEEEDAFQENGSGGRNDNSNNASTTGEDEDEDEVQQTRRAVRSRGSSGEIFEHASRPSHSSAIEERLAALLESKLDGFRKEVRALRAESLSRSQVLHDKTSELLVLYHDILSRLMGVPGGMGASIAAAKLSDAEPLAHTVTEKEQSMVATKVRAQYDAVPAEEDITLERTASEHDQLRAKVDEIQSVMMLRATDATTLRTMELDKTLSRSLAQFEKSNVTIEGQQKRILEPDNLSREPEADERVGEQALVSKVYSQEAQVGSVLRDTDAAVDALAALRMENDALAFHQSHCDDLRRTNEPELQELLRGRERSKVLECECAALRRRHEEPETYVASSNCAVSAVRASLAQAQQRAAEWEQRANENAAVLEEAQAVRDQAEDRASQLEAENVLLRMQLEEKERLAKERERKLSDQVVALEAQLTVADAVRLDTCVTQ